MSLKLDSKEELETFSERLPTKRRTVKDVLIFLTSVHRGDTEETLITKRGKDRADVVLVSPTLNIE